METATTLGFQFTVSSRNKAKRQNLIIIAVGASQQ